jgi:hypothetical protein
VTWGVTHEVTPFPASVPALLYRFGKVDSMTESGPAQPGQGAQAAGDALAARLLVA